MSALYLLANSNANSSQWLPIFAAAAPRILHYLADHRRTTLLKQSSTGRSSVLRQCNGVLPARASLVSAKTEVAPQTVWNGLSSRCRILTWDKFVQPKRKTLVADVQCFGIRSPTTSTTVCYRRRHLPPCLSILVTSSFQIKWFPLPAGQMKHHRHRVHFGSASHLFHPKFPLPHQPAQQNAMLMKISSIVHFQIMGRLTFPSETMNSVCSP